MPPNATRAQSRQMMQTLLSERFKLAAHRETRQLPVYAFRIVAGKSNSRHLIPTKVHQIGRLPSAVRRTTHGARSVP